MNSCITGYVRLPVRGQQVYLERDTYARGPWGPMFRWRPITPGYEDLGWFKTREALRYAVLQRYYALRDGLHIIVVVQDEPIEPMLPLDDQILRAAAKFRVLCRRGLLG